MITFGGIADGDVALGTATTAYFEGLRAALPDAELVAIAPISTADTLPYFVTMHGQSIATSVTAVDGVFVNAGQPAIGGGADLSPEVHAQIAEAVVSQLRASVDGATQ